VKIIVGLGNPGKKYQHTRHNIGFMVLDRLGQREELKFKKSFRCHARIARAHLEGNDVMLAKPALFMNNSGISVRGVLKKYKTQPEDLLVIYDDADLPLGRMLFKLRGSCAGHRGIDSIIECLSTEEIPRLRIGIGRPQSGDLVEYVLSPFSSPEESAVDTVLERAVSFCFDWLKKPAAEVMGKYNSTLN